MPVPHKHAALIKAWADGAVIECKLYGEWAMAGPSWNENVEYRIKPEPHKHQDLIDAFRSGATDIQINDGDGKWTTPVEYWKDHDFHPDAELRRAHKWQKEMDAFAAGKQIQFRSPVTQNKWSNTPIPAWLTHDRCEYRIAPEKVERYGFVGLFTTSHVTPMREMGDNLKLTFEDGKLVAAEVLK